MLTEQSTIVASKNQVSCDLSGETVLLNLQKGVYYGLDQVGNRVWNLIQQPKTIHEIQQVISEEYEVDADQCRQDLLVLMEELQTNGLIEVQG